MSRNRIGWNHPTDQADQWDGFNESGMQHFAGSPIRHLAREIIQNALDAGNSDHSVIVKIKLHEVRVSDIPNIDELKENIEACNNAAKKEGRKAEIFFKQAKKELSKPTIQVLEISDFNTTGMVGPCVNGTPYFAFMKAKGQSKKESAIAGGSYGIGKFAPYTVSKLRTIFVSTVYKDAESGEYIQLTQAKSILMSHDVEKLRKQGAGFWGIKERCQPVIGVDNTLPEWIVRADDKAKLASSLGSKLSILCFDAEENWQEILLASIAENFFAAISEGRLKVEINGEYVLEKNNINDIFSDESIGRLIPLIKDQQDDADQFINSKHYLMAYQYEKHNDVITEESQTKHLGLCELRILVSDNLPKKVCALRNGMFITDNLKRLKQFSDFKEFAAVFICHDKDGNALLRAMEPPRHDDFEVDLLPKEDKVKGNKALKEIAEWVRQCLQRYAKDPVSDVAEIEELRDFFGEEGSGDTGRSVEEINPFGKVVIRAKQIKLKINNVPDTSNSGYGSEMEAIAEEGEEANEGGGGGSDGEGGGKGKGGDGQGVGDGSGDLGGSGGLGKAAPKDGVNSQAGKGNISTEIINIRAPILSAKERRISFTPLKSGKIRVVVKEAGADTDYDLPIMKSNLGLVKNEELELDVVSGMRVSIDVELNQEYLGALKVLAYEI